jgi:hypothetical protein
MDKADAKTRWKEQYRQQRIKNHIEKEGMEKKESKQYKKTRNQKISSRNKISKFKIIIIIFCVSMCIAGYFGWKTETFQKNVFPKKYWGEQIDMFERSIRTDKYLIRSAKIELQKIHITLKFELAEASNTAQFLGTDVDKATQDRMKKVQGEINNVQREIEIFRESLKKNENLLRQARIEYSKQQ